MLLAFVNGRWFDGEKFVELMDDLHRALVVKVYFTVCQADRKWSQGERSLAEHLIEHLWKRRGSAARTVEVDYSAAGVTHRRR
jgi:hypothetical protein